MEETYVLPSLRDICRKQGHFWVQQATGTDSAAPNAWGKRSCARCGMKESEETGER